ncbi:MAG: transposase family protein [Candidatus Competibacteraceae bacterium]|nr:transposase family protein [Candidatus Competibacteraceae bacterium]
MSCYVCHLAKHGRKRHNRVNAIQAKGGRKPILTKHEDRLLFILFYLKTYPLQEVLAHLFGMSQGQAHFLIYQLSRILRETLKRMDHLPARTSEEMIRKLAEEEPQDFAVDGTRDGFSARKTPTAKSDSLVVRKGNTP